MLRKCLQQFSGKEKGAGKEVGSLFRNEILMPGRSLARWVDTPTAGCLPVLLCRGPRSVCACRGLRSERLAPQWPNPSRKQVGRQATWRKAERIVGWIAERIVNDRWLDI